MSARGASLYNIAKLLGNTAATVEGHFAPFVKDLRDRSSESWNAVKVWRKPIAQILHSSASQTKKSSNAKRLSGG
jgi:hypothetical protein